MTERRVNQVLEEWRTLERRLAREAADQAPLRARIRELRAEYQRLTAATVEDDEHGPTSEKPADTAMRNR